MLAWLKSKFSEKRSYSNLILSALESAVATQAANVAQSAAVEAVGGLLARSLSSAKVDAPAWLRDAISPSWLAQVGRELIRGGEHLSLVRMNAEGDVNLLPSSNWDWSGAPDERGWRARVTTSGPSGSITREVGREGVVFIQWARLALEPHRGYSPASLANLAARAAAEAEKSLGDEASGPISQLLSVPDGHGGDDEEFGGLRADIAKARGKALLLETTAGGYGDRGGSPHRDWVAARLGPNPPESLVKLASDTFSRLVASCGASVSLFTDADGTAQREAWRRWHLSSVLPVAGLIEAELLARFETSVRFNFDMYATDLAGRAQAFQKLVAGGVAVNEALQVSGLLAGDE